MGHMSVLIHVNPTILDIYVKSSWCEMAHPTKAYDTRQQVSSMHNVGKLDVKRQASIPEPVTQALHDPINTHLFIAGGERIETNNLP